MKKEKRREKGEYGRREKKERRQEKGDAHCRWKEKRERRQESKRRGDATETPPPCINCPAERTRVRPTEKPGQGYNNWTAAKTGQQA